MSIQHERARNRPEVLGWYEERHALITEYRYQRKGERCVLDGEDVGVLSGDAGREVFDALHELLWYEYEQRLLAANADLPDGERYAADDIDAIAVGGNERRGEVARAGAARCRAVLARLGLGKVLADGRNVDHPD